MILWINKRSSLVTAFTLATLVGMFFWPLTIGQTFSKTGAHMQVIYPWNGLDFDRSHITGIRSPMTDTAESSFPFQYDLINSLQQNNEIPTWNPNILGGIPQLDTGLRGFGYPIKVILARCLSPVFYHNSFLIIHFTATLLSAFWLFYILTKSKLGGIFCATLWAYSLSCNFFLLFYDLQVWTAILPLAIAFNIHFSRRFTFIPATVSALIMGLGFSSISFTARHWLIAAFLLLCQQAYYGLRANANTRKRYVLYIIYSWLLAALISLPSWLPLFLRIGEATRIPYDIAYIQSQSIGIAEILKNFIIPDTDKIGTSIIGAPMLFSGTGALILAFLGIFNYRSRLSQAGIALTALSLALVTGSPFIYKILIRMPVMGSLRPDLCVPLLSFSFIILVSAGIRKLADLTNNPLISYILCPIFLVTTLQLVYLNGVLLPRCPNKSQYFYPTTPLLAMARQVQGEFRSAAINYRPPDGAWNPPMLLGNTFLPFGLRMSGGYESVINLETFSLWKSFETGVAQIVNQATGTWRTWMFSDALNLNLAKNLSVRWLICVPRVLREDTKFIADIKNKQLKVVYDGPDGILVEVVDSLPRIFFTSSVKNVKTWSDALNIMSSKSYSAQDAALCLESVAPIQSTNINDAQLHILGDAPGNIKIDYHSKTPQSLIINESYDKGWQASFNTNRLSIVRCNVNSMLISIPAGTGTVHLRHESRIWKISSAIAILTWSYGILILLFSLISRRNKRMHTAHSFPHL